MAECRDELMRETLPLLVRDEGLPAEALAAARAHVATCAACQAELALLSAASRAIEARVPRVDVSAIAAGVRNATRLRLEPAAGATRAAPARSPMRWVPRRYAAMAASLVLVASASLAVLLRTGGGDATLGGAIDSLANDSARLARAAAGTDLSVAGGLSDLSEDDLRTLLEELDRVEGTVAAEPVALRSAIVDVPEEF